MCVSDLGGCRQLVTVKAFYPLLLMLLQIGHADLSHKFSVHFHFRVGHSWWLIFSIEVHPLRVTVSQAL